MWNPEQPDLLDADIGAGPLAFLANCSSFYYHMLRETLATSLLRVHPPLGMITCHGPLSEVKHELDRSAEKLAPSGPSI